MCERDWYKIGVEYELGVYERYELEDELKPVWELVCHFSSLKYIYLLLFPLKIKIYLHDPSNDLRGVRAMTWIRSLYDGLCRVELRAWVRVCIRILWNISLIHSSLIRIDLMREFFRYKTHISKKSIWNYKSIVRIVLLNILSCSIQEWNGRANIFCRASSFFMIFSFFHYNVLYMIASSSHEDRKTSEVLHD